MNEQRRDFLRTVGVGAAAFTAGCPGDRSDPEPTSTTGEDDGGTDEESPTHTDDTSDDGSDPAELTETTIISMEAGGADIWNEAGKGHFYYATASGDFDVGVHVASIENTNPHAKAGIMARESLESTARNVMVRRRAGFGTSPQWRPIDGEATTSTTSEDGAPLSEVDGGYVENANWQRLERDGDTIRAYASADGEEWTRLVELGPDVIELSDEVFLGLAATSHERTQVTTATFRGLEGVVPTDNQDIGNPIEAGSVSVTEAAVVSTLDPADVSASAATLRADLELMGEADAVDVGFEYREVTEADWTASDVETATEPGTVEVDVSDLVGRRYYQFRAIADDGENEVVTVARQFATPSDSPGSTDEGPRSAAHHDPSDGFATVAPWLDDDTPIVAVSEPTRDALARAVGVDGPRVVAFETSGSIDLEDADLAVRNDQCWIAGQTAPSPGITLVRGGLWIYGNDCVVQHLRVRPGDAGMDEDDGWQPDAIQTADDTENNVIDHCTGTWSVDENVNAGYDTTDTTISNCLIAEPLNDSVHEKGAHGYNTIIGDRAENVSLLGNVWALATDRNPRLKEGTRTVVVNNLVHHYHDGVWMDPDTEAVIEGNVYRRPMTDQANVFGEGRAFVRDNDPDPDADVPMVGDGITELDDRPLWPDGLEAMPVADVADHALGNAGARPADRTDHDERILDLVGDDEGGVIDGQEDVGGYPDLAVNERELDEPDRDLRAWLRERALAVEQ